MRPYRVVCLGNVLVDVLVKPVDRLPPKGGLLPVERLEISVGGCASNTALALRRLGVTVSLWGKLGKDFFGDFALAHFKKAGLGTTHLPRQKGVSTSATVVAVDSRGQRSFFHSMAANDQIHWGDLPLKSLSRHRHLHVGGISFSPSWMENPWPGC